MSSFWVLISRFRGEILRFDLKWLCLTVALLKVLFGVDELISKVKINGLTFASWTMAAMCARACQLWCAFALLSC